MFYLKKRSRLLKEVQYPMDFSHFADFKQMLLDEYINKLHQQFKAAF